MTTIEYGGGPSLDQRRSFAGLKDGSMIPGYGGYCPQLKFDHGKTYGQNTFDISQQRRSKQPITASIYEQPITTKIHPDSNIPESTGDNKYTKTWYLDTQMTRDRLLSRQFLDTKDFVPRIYTTELGLGCRYHDMTRNGLESFYSNLYRRHPGRKTVTFGDHAHQQNPNRILSASTTNLEDSNKRVYKQDGMIPKYTGYLPQKRFEHGFTYGDTSRSLDVCAHSQECYGEYLKTVRHSPYVA